MEQPLIQLSQGHLKLLSLCPRKYQYTYLDQLFIPSLSAHTDEQEKLGRQFHLLMQQHWMGLDIMPLLETSLPLKERFQAFQAHPPDIIEGDRFTEHRRMLKVGPYLLVGIFDLLALNPGAGQIIDWKSYRKPRSSEHLRQSWQTKLYPYLLAETSELEPEQISMTYWFSQTSSTKESHTYSFQYSDKQHQTTHQTLTQHLKQLDQWCHELEDGQRFPQVDFSKGHCLSDNFQCPYLFRCERSPEQRRTEALLDIAAMPDIPVEFILNPSSVEAR